MRKFFPNIDAVKEVKSLYRASKNGFTAAKFHYLCNNKGSSLTLIENNYYEIFGGFTKVAWDNSNAFKEDTAAFLFFSE